jgi:uncharacterized protein (TIGR03118 family)
MLSLTCGTAMVSAKAQATQHYKQTPLVSNLASLAPTVDPHLVNAWGMARSSTSPWWIADNGTGLSTLYTGTGSIVPLVVTIPSADTSASPTGTPTGIVFNGDANVFMLNGKAATFILATEDGSVSAWNGGTMASIVVNQTPRSVFKGITIASTTEFTGKLATYLYVADFRQGRVEIFDSSFNPVHSPGFGIFGFVHGVPFTDDQVPNGFAPFNVQNIGGDIYVTYAKQDNAKHDEVDGAGRGYVDVFSPGGTLLMRLEHGPWLNAPWGLVMASSDFGLHSHDILVGQFGSGEILAFDHATGKFRGALQGTNDQPLVINGLWGLGFGNGGTAGPATSLFFAAGIDDEQNGLFGTITAVENVRGGDR